MKQDSLTMFWEGKFYLVRQEKSVLVNPVPRFLLNNNFWEQYLALLREVIILKAGDNAKALFDRGEFVAL